MSKTKWMGSIVTIVASRVAPLWPPEIRLPASTLRSEMRPAIGAVTLVHSRLSSACRSDDSADLNWARAIARLALRWSNSASVMVLDLISAEPRSTCSSARSTCALLRATSACALSTAISNGRLSIVDRRSPTLTSWPSRKWILSMKPETRARTSTATGELVPLGDALGQRRRHRDRHRRGAALRQAGRDTCPEGAKNQADDGQQAAADGQAKLPGETDVGPARCGCVTAHCQLLRIRTCENGSVPSDGGRNLVTPPAGPASPR